MDPELLEGFRKLAREIGQDRYWLLDEDQQAAVAFGMTPIEIAEEFIAEMREMIGSALAEKFGTPADPQLAKSMGDNLKPKLVSELERSFVLGLMDSAKSVGRMIA